MPTSFSVIVVVLIRFYFGALRISILLCVFYYYVNLWRRS